MTPGAARVALTRWKTDGLAAPAGLRTGLWYNLVREPQGAEVLLGSVLKRHFGSPIIIGPTILNSYGWTPQAPHVLTIAVPFARTYAEVEGVHVHGRRIEWYGLVHKAWMKAERGHFQLAALPPEVALADALSHEETLAGLKPDDIEIPEDTVNLKLLKKALDSFQVPQDRYQPFLDCSNIELDADQPRARPRR